MISERLNALKKQLALLAEKIEDDKHRKQRIQNIQDDYSRRACELGNWLEQAEEEVAGIVNFQTKETSEDCHSTLVDILEALRNEKLEQVGDLELLEVELAELNEDVNTFTWYSYKTLSTRMDRLDQTICDRIKVVNEEIRRHSENEKICDDAARTLQMCRNIIIEAKKEFDHLHSLKLDDQRDKLLDLIDKVQGSGMIKELEQWRSIMGSRYIFNNKFTSLTPHGVLVDTYQVLELMNSMLRSVEQSIADRNSSGVTEKQIREFELAFEYFDQDKKGYLDYEHFELCIKSQGYDFTIDNAGSETMRYLDPSSSGHVLKSDYMRWMVKNETTNILDDHSAIEDALKSLNARKISDSMSRKEAEFFMRKIAKHTETFSEHIHLEYKDFVDSFY
uniref:EF-hand domain-containing protein n=1 Tax=Caenorhabditis tropicalis TaxID=1561998 RepID=A0A1I7V4X2_9PELO